jgi:NAD/NADP transhydrogenase beta subunit
MALGTLPYKAKVVAAAPLPSGDFNLTIQVLDGNLNVLNTTQMAVSAQSAGSDDVRAIRDALDDAVFSQMLNDAGGFAAAALGLSVEFGE